METIRVSNEERDALMPRWVTNNEALRYYWRNSLSERMALRQAYESEYRSTEMYRIRVRLEQRYQEMLDS